ncbi:protein RESTRICTED TEV MOVEMENT 2-like [Benincasa hispida]|uniref:protein RESTRICTED TEV MOVEMENT 2-like n=1 Tax=Benincasa hispida TaxID=102211 RepID=UPI0019011DE4|nr:protein RESTRICTED TEV MOVEMENT 2-like [Benincasa hispida]
MATARPRIGGLGALRRQSMRVYNEPFTPNVEESDEKEAHILRLQLPEFNEHHVKVKVEKEAGTVVVTGDRNMGNNRLLILDKTYSIPQNSQIDKIEHKLQDGILTITIPKQITEPVTAPPLQAAESMAAPENAAPPETMAEINEPDAAALPKADSTPEKGREENSPENVALPEKKAEIKEPDAAALPKDDSSPEKGKEEISPEIAAPPETMAESKEPKAAALPKDDSYSVKPTEKNNGKSAELQKQDSVKAAKEEAPTPAPLVAPQPAAAEKDPVQGDSGKAETTSDQKISSPDQNREIENQDPKKGKDSKSEEVDKNEETAKIGTGTPSPRATKVGKLAGGFTVRRLPLRATVSLSATVAIAVAAYFAYAYYGFSFAME